MKTTKKILSIILIVLMLLNFESAVFAAEDNGTGTETNPYKISTAQDLQAINNNVSAHYILTADIDLKDVDFTPIGNADSGAFSGSFDGNGYKIKNLNIFSGKYAGLFGCNEGVIRNVVLENVFVYGTRYVGGIVGQNTALGMIENCSVLSGAVESDGGLYDIYGGGICGYNEGTVKGVLSNSASVTIAVDSSSSINIYAGGLIGYSLAAVSLADCYNTGTVSTSYAPSYYSCSGGFIGYANSKTEITNSHNTGVISSSYCSGGFIGYANSKTEITNSHNTGVISSSYYSGGFIGYVNSATVTITNSCNIGDVYDVYSGGFIGYVSSATVTITNSYNTGNVYAVYPGGFIGYANSATVTITITNSYNTGNVYSRSVNHDYSGGFIGNANSATLTITNSYNTGNVYAFHSGGFIGNANSATVTITNSYNTGNIYSRSGNYGYSGGFIGNAISASVTITNSYILKSASKEIYENKGTILSSAEMKNSSSFEDWDFESLWMMPTNGNSGYPVFKNVGSPLSVNISNAVLIAGETIKLTAYKNGTAISNVEWSCSYGNSVVSKTGNVTAVTGYSTITATDSEGNKANCNIYVMPQINLSVKINDFSVNQGKSTSSTCSFGNTSSGDFLVDVSSSDSDIISITSYSDNNIIFSAKNPGTATISVETAQGFKDTCTATVTNYTDEISIDRSSLTAARGSSYQLNATTKPYFSSSPVVWSSSNPDVATVDSTGKVTCVAIGTAIIAAKSNGRDATCTVTVTAPVTSMAFEKHATKIYVQDTEQLKLILDPADATDSISYSSSNTSVAKVSSTGLVTANTTAGTTVITATSSSGIKAYHTVTVMDYPVIVTDITLDQSEKDLLVGEVFKLKATVTPSNATSPGVTWASTDETVATVSNSGTVEATGAGKTLITAETENGIIAYCIVNVTGAASTNLSKIYVPDVVASGDSTVDIPVIIEKNPGINFASIRVIYDPDVMEAVSVENGTVFNSLTGTIDSGESTVRLFFTSQTNVTVDGILAKIRFNILDNTKEASVKVCYFPSEIRNDAMEAVSFNLRDGRYVQLKCEHSETEIRDVVAATCTTNGYSGDEYCIDCGTLVQNGRIAPANGHNFADATCTAPKTCTVCDATEGSANGHKFDNDCDTTCNSCTYTRETAHKGGTATCKEKAKCTVCGTSYGSLASHNYAAATCTKAKTCKVCGVTSGKANGHKYTNNCDTTCNTCKATRKITHSYKTTTTKATLSKNGKTEIKCTVCGAVSKTTTIYYPKTIKLAETKYTYNGKVKTPTVTVKDSKGKTLKKDTDYTVKYASGRKSTGKYAVTVTFKGKYSGTKTLYFNILPSKTSKITPTCSTTEIKASWKSVTGASGYKVELLNSKGKVVKAITTTKTAYTFEKLSKVTTYKIRVTAYKTIDSKKVYSTISTTITTSTAPAKVTLLKVTAGSKSATLTWKTVSGATGYEVSYSTSSKFKSAKTATVTKGSSKKTTIKKLTKGKKYYFKVRTYKTVDGKKVYGAWSAVKSVKVK